MRSIKFLLLVALIVPIELLSQQASWELVRSNFWGKIAIDPANSDIIYVSPGRFPEFGLHKSTDDGKTWTYIRQGYEGLDDVKGILVDPKNPQRLWVYGGPGKGVIRSEDGGLTAVRSDTGIYSDHHGFEVDAFAYDSQRHILYAGDFSAGGIYRSFDGGRSWDLILAYGAGLMFNPYSFMAEEDSGWVYSGTWGSGILRSKDFGMTWMQLHPQVLNGLIASIARVPNSRTLYAAGGLGTDYSPGRIYKSFDLGENWFLTSDATTDSSELSGGLLVSSLDTNYVYVGGRGGAAILKGGFFLSRDSGQSWRIYLAGLPQYDLSQYNVWSLVQTPNSSYLYLSLLAGFQNQYSVYRLSQTLLTPIQESPSPSQPSNFSMQQNYPNPFNAQTKIEFSIARKELINLEVYNVKGERVARLVNKQMNAGKYSVTWNGKDSRGGDVPSGIYLFRLKAVEEVVIRKALLIR